MTKSVAENHGLRATFMPKPVEGLTGNGCHAHISVWDRPGARSKNVFAPTREKDSRGTGAVQTGAHFLGGIMKHAKRLGCDHQSDGEQLQAHQRAAHNIRAHMGTQHGDLERQQPHAYGAGAGTGAVRTRLPDGAANPYLLQASHHRGRAGWRAVRRLIRAKRHDIDMYAEGTRLRMRPNCR